MPLITSQTRTVAPIGSISFDGSNVTVDAIIVGIIKLPIIWCIIINVMLIDMASWLFGSMLPLELLVISLSSGEKQHTILFIGEDLAIMSSLLFSLNPNLI